MRVHTYVDQIPGSGAEPIIELWRDSWQAHGWTCVVLGEQDFLKLPFAGAMDFMARRMPTVNDWRYERACWRRWLAFAGAGGGVTADFDVINVGFEPKDLPPHKGKLMRFNREAPCCQFGSLWNYLQAVDMFLQYSPQPDDLHGNKMCVEDMIVLNRYPHVADYHDLCAEWKPDHSNTEKLVHFCARAVTEAGTTKEKAIHEFLETRKPQ